MAKVCVVGLGYIGLPTAIIMAEHGIEVVGFDVDAQRVDRINTCDPVIHEPEIFERLQTVVQQKTFRARHHIEEADYFIIAVPTPFTEEKKPDLSHVMQATKTIASKITPGATVILESTVPVGATKQVATVLEQETTLLVGSDIYVAHCPERVLPGKIFKELINNARSIGGITPACVEHAKKLYKQFVCGPLYLTDATTAEMVKLVENSSRDVAIAFANQVASMAHHVGLDPYEVIELANKHPRVDILRPGCGVGGHCIAVDPWFLVDGFPQQTELLKTARHVNDAKPLEVVDRVKHAAAQWKKKHNKPCTVLVLGLAYKPDVDDLRESPACTVTRYLMELPDINLTVCEPMVSDDVVQQMVPVSVTSLEQGIEHADIIVCLVAHTAFKENIHAVVGTKTIIDSCGLLYQARQESQAQEQLFWPASSDYTWPDFNDGSQSTNEQEYVA